MLNQAPGISFFGVPLCLGVFVAKLIFEYTNEKNTENIRTAAANRLSKLRYLYNYRLQEMANRVGISTSRYSNTAALIVNDFLICYNDYR
jgi:hypothetical protein